MIYTRKESHLNKAQPVTQRLPVKNILKTLLKKTQNQPQCPVTNCENSASKENTHALHSQPLKKLESPSNFIENSPSFPNAGRNLHLSLSSVIDIKIAFCGSKKDEASDKKYVRLLEVENKQLLQQVSELKIDDSGTAIKHRLHKLQQFFFKGKNCLVSSSMQLIECKGMLNQGISQERLQLRLASINCCLTKNQEVLSLHQSAYHNIEPQKASVQVSERESMAVELQELKQISLCQANQIKGFQQKHPDKSVINELSLCRHQINRLSQQNQNYRSQMPMETRLKYWTECSTESQQLRTRSQKKSNNYYYGKETIACNKEVQTDFNQHQISQLMDSSYKLTVEKDYLMSLYEQQSHKNEELQHTLALFQQDFQLKQQQSAQFIQQLQTDQEVWKISALKAQKQLRQCSQRNQNPVILSTLLNQGTKGDSINLQTLTKFLNRKENEVYNSIFQRVIKKYEHELSTICEHYHRESSLKERLLHWSNEVYQSMRVSGTKLLSRELTKFQRILETVSETQIQVYLKQIKALTVGIDEKESQQMAEELKQYVQTLKTRLPSLKEVDEASFSLNSSLCVVQKPIDRYSEFI